jgi:protein arginine N-methyltransferase 7
MLYLVQPLAGLARQIIHHNQLHSLMDVHAVRSDDWTPAQKADVLVSEILDSELLGEGVLPCIRDAQKRLLNADAKIVPAAATVWAQVCSFISHFHNTFIVLIAFCLPSVVRMPRAV